MCSIKTLRKRLRLSPRQLGLIAGLTGKNVSRTVLRWESGDLKPSDKAREKLKKLSEPFRV